jgi:hypothetical protein
LNNVDLYSSIKCCLAQFATKTKKFLLLDATGPFPYRMFANIRKGKITNREGTEEGTEVAIVNVLVDEGLTSGVSLKGGNSEKGLVLQSTIVSVPSSELAPPTPSPPASVIPPSGYLGGDTLACGGRVGGEPIHTTGQKLWHSVYSVDGKQACSYISYILVYEIYFKNQFFGHLTDFIHTCIFTHSCIR